MNDDDIMPFGKHMGEYMANVPAVWLIWFFESYQNKPQIELTEMEKEVIGYIWRTGIELLRKEAKNVR